MLACTLLAPQIEEAVGEPHLLGIFGLGVDRERQRLGLGRARRSSAICSSISPVGSFGLTVSGERCDDLPGHGDDAFEPQRVGRGEKRRASMSITHCVMP